MLGLNPEWKESYTFEYETKFAKKIHLKSMRVEVWDHDYFSANDFLGATEVDLHTIATGPVHHRRILKSVRVKHLLLI